MSLIYCTSDDIVNEVGHDQWHGLTVMPEKKEFYSRDVYFREAWRDANITFNENTVGILQNIAVLVFKPDSFMARKSQLALDYLIKHNFIPIVWREFRYNHWTMREDWRYQLNQFSLDRIFLNEKLLTSEDCTIVIFRDNSSKCELPGTVRLQSLKGSSLPELHKPEQLRAILKSHNRLFKFVHTADEPADIIRESGIIFSKQERQSLFQDIARNFQYDNSAQLANYLQEKTARFALCDFSWPPALEELRMAVKKSPYPSAAEVLFNDISQWLNQGIPNGQVLSAQELEIQLAQLETYISNEAFMIICTNLIHHSYALEFALMRGDGLDDWLAGKGKYFSFNKSDINSIEGVV
ncbi:hypothetical protein [Brenneria uluponensis]|uniref:hypothetical protein n=1 Tax=Brenneria uluponensis TaxID=3057057 RepID=UPI0028E3DBDE|nr:hypothetical protein [Brenneria ulupoensis]